MSCQYTITPWSFCVHTQYRILSFQWSGLPLFHHWMCSRRDISPMHDLRYNCVLWDRNLLGAQLLQRRLYSVSIRKIWTWCYNGVFPVPHQHGRCGWIVHMHC
jgi:hypothetical protein